MTQRESTDHEEAHAAGDGDVHHRRVRQALVDLGQVVGGETDTGVVDLDQHAAVGQRVTGDLDAGLRAGERGGVLEQLGEEVHEVVDDAAGDVRRRHRGQFDALVLLHLGGGGAEHVDQRDGAGPTTTRVLTRENQEVLTVTTHTRREVVELEQLGQLVRVGLARLQLGDHRQLALDQTLGAAREVGEHRVDVASEQGLLGGESDGLAVDLVEGSGHVPDLVRGVDADRLDRDVHVLRIGLGELADHLRQRVLGDVLGGLLQLGQRAHHRAGHQGGAEDGDEENGDDQTGVGVGVRLRLRAQVGRGGVELLDQEGLVLVHLQHLRAGAGRPVGGAQQVRLLVQGGARLQHLAGPAGRFGDVGVALPGADQVLGLGRAVERGELFRRRRGVGQGCRGVLAVARRQGRRGVRVAGLGVGQGAEDRGPDDGHVLVPLREGLERPGRLDQLQVRGREGEVLGDLGQRGDQVVELGDGLLQVAAGQRVVERAALDGRQLVELGLHRVDVDAATGELRLVERVDQVGQLLTLPVRLLLVVDDGAVFLDRLVLHAARARHVVALLLERGGEQRGGLGDLTELGDVVQLLLGLERALDAQTTEDDGGDHGQHQKGGQPGTDAPVAEREALGPTGPGRGHRAYSARSATAALLVGLGVLLGHAGRAGRTGVGAGAARRGPGAGALGGVGGIRRRLLVASCSAVRRVARAATPLDTSLH